MNADLVFLAVRWSAATLAWLLTYALHSTIAIAVAAIICRFADPAHRSHLFRDALLKVALLAGVVTATAHGLGAAPDAPVRHDISRVAEHFMWPAPAIPPSPGTLPTAVDWLRLVPVGLLLLWVGWAAWVSLRLLTATRRARAAIGPRAVVQHPALLATFRELAASMAVRAPLTLTSAPRLVTPVALGQHEVCIPPRVETELSPAERRSVLAHEVAHVARRDPLWLLAAASVESVFFFQPLNRWVRRRLQDEAEFLADEMAAQKTHDSVSLARGLSRVAEWLARSPNPPLIAPALAEGRSSLLRRVERLVALDAPPARSGRLGILAGSVAVALPALAWGPVVSAGDVRAWGRPAFQWSGAIASGQTIEIDGTMGAIRAVASRNDSAVVIATRHGTAMSPDIRFEVIPHAGGVTICALYPVPANAPRNRCAPGAQARRNTRENDVEVEFLVRVPRGVGFTGRTVLGRITTDSLTGDVSATTMVDDIDVTTAGVAIASSYTGNINVRMGARSWSDTVRISSVTGNVRVRINAGAEARVVARSMAGRMRSALPEVPPPRRGVWSRLRLRGSLGESASGILGRGSGRGVLSVLSQTGHVRLTRDQRAPR